jgi:hypothetical protein
MVYHLISIRKASIKRQRDKNCWQWCVEKANLVTVGRNVNWQSYYRKQYVGSLKIKNSSTIGLKPIFIQENENSTS